MDDLAFLRERIEYYADYTNDDRRRLVDDQVRAYVGEALARVLERLRASAAASEALARVILRCQFADQSVVRAFELEEPTVAQIAAIHRADRELVAFADRADTVAAAGLEEYVAQIDAALDRRSRIVTSGGAATAAVPPPR